MLLLLLILSSSCYGQHVLLLLEQLHLLVDVVLLSFLLSLLVLSGVFPTVHVDIDLQFSIPSCLCHLVTCFLRCFFSRLILAFMAFVSLFTMPLMTFVSLSVAIIIIFRPICRFLGIRIVLTTWFTVVLAFIVMIIIRVIVWVWPTFFILVLPWTISMIRIFKRPRVIHIIQGSILLVIVIQTFLVALFWVMFSVMMMSLVLILLHRLRLLLRRVSIGCQVIFVLRPLISQIGLLWGVSVRSVLPSINFILRVILCNLSTVSLSHCRWLRSCLLVFKVQSPRRLLLGELAVVSLGCVLLLFGFEGIFSRSVLVLSWALHTKETCLLSTVFFNPAYVWGWMHTNLLITQVRI